MGNVFLCVDASSIEVEVGRIVMVESFKGFGGEYFRRVDDKDFRMKGEPVAVETLI